MWETLYFVRDYGTPTDPQFPNTQYYAYATANADALTMCGGRDVERPFAVDANGAMVEIGPFAGRLDTRPDILSRMRIIVQRHELEPHEAAVPMALTGRPVGQPNAADLGAHIQRAPRRRAHAGPRVAARLRVRDRRPGLRQRGRGGAGGYAHRRGAPAAHQDR